MEPKQFTTAEHGLKMLKSDRHDFAWSGMIRTERRGAWHWLGCAPKVNPARQIAACPENGLGLWCGRSSWEDANGLDCDPRVEPKANASHDAHRPPIRQGVPVDRAAREGNRCRPIHDGTPASGSRCQKVRRRRGMDAASALSRAGRCDLQEYPRMGRCGRAPAPPAGKVRLQRTAEPVGQKR